MDAVDVIVIGGGIVGLSSASHLRREGLSFVVLERAEEVGGTWRDHDYPGCGADTEASTYVPSAEPLYTERRFATRDELFDYCKRFADKHVGYEHIRLGRTVLRASFSSADDRWTVTTDREVFRARFVVWATFSGGDAGKIKRPSFPGEARFGGVVVHSSQLSRDLSFFAGKRVAIIGCGATTVQLAPTIHPVVEHMTIFSRTVPYIKRTALGRGPRSRLAYRLQGALLRLRNEMISFFDQHPHLEALYRWPYRLHEYWLKRDGLPAAAIPPSRQPVQCTRRGFDYLGFRATLTRPNVAFVRLREEAGIEGYSERGLIVDGRETPADIVVLATGYHMAELNFEIEVDGAPFVLDPERFRGVYGLIDGLPNALLAIFGSPLWIIPPRLAEFNTKTFLKLIRHMRANDYTRVEIDPERARRTTELVQRLNRKHIVLQPSCPSHRYLLSTTVQEAAGELPAKTAANLPFVPFPSAVMEAITRLTFAFGHFRFGRRQIAVAADPAPRLRAVATTDA